MLTRIVLSILSLSLINNNKNSWELKPGLILTINILVLTVYPLIDFTYLLSKNSILDSISLLIIFLSIWISPLIIITGYKLKKIETPKAFTMTVIVLLRILIICFSVCNLLLFYILFEASLIPTMLLIILWGNQPERKTARFYIIIYTVTASLPILIIILKLIVINFHINLTLINLKIPTTINQSIRWIILIIVFMVKLPLFSLHIWLPKAHVEAPVAGSIVLAAILLKLGGYGIIRINKLIHQQLRHKSYTIISVAIIGAIVTNTICLRQTDLKALIAYSSVGHIGLLIIRSLSNSKIGQYSRLVIMFTHGLTSSCIFFLTNILYEKINTRNIIIIRGIINLIPINSLAWITRISINIALPPRRNLIGEITAIISRLYISKSLIFLLIITNFLTTAYSLYLYFIINHGNQLTLTNPSIPISSVRIINTTTHLWPLIILTTLPTKLISWC